MSTILLLILTSDPVPPAPLPTVPLERRQCVSRLLVVSEVLAGSGLAMIGGAVVDARNGGHLGAPLAVVGGAVSLGGLTMLINLRPVLKGEKPSTPQGC